MPTYAVAPIEPMPAVFDLARATVEPPTSA